MCVMLMLYDMFVNIFIGLPAILSNEGVLIS